MILFHIFFSKNHAEFLKLYSSMILYPISILDKHVEIRKVQSNLFIIFDLPKKLHVIIKIRFLNMLYIQNGHEKKHVENNNQR